MKNKIFRISLKNVIDGFSCILDFPNISVRGGNHRAPLYKGNTSMKPLKSFFQQQQQPKAKKEPESPPPSKQSTRNLSLGYTEIKKGGVRWGKMFFVWFVIGLF